MGPTGDHAAGFLKLRVRRKKSSPEKGYERGAGRIGTQAEMSR